MNKELKDNFKLARSIKRKFILNLGPTNSGKTYQAFEKLKNYESGCYLAPLRLLAQEGQTEIKKRGLKCSLLTGEEIINEPNATFVSSTIEMADLDKPVQVAVIDEVQLLKDDQRGFAWINAVLGIPADYVICCGSTEIKDILLTLIEYCNDEIIEDNEYQRKVPLQAIQNCSLKNAEPGDAIIAFSRKDVLSYRDYFINHHKKVSVIYGNLSPEIRRQQSELFNTGETEILIATDAIGMGLNLPIKRILFSTIEKFDGNSFRELTVSELKQISGRAGRFGKYDVGYVGGIGLSKQQLLKIKKCISSISKQYNKLLYYSPLKHTIGDYHKKVSWKKSLIKWEEESQSYLNNLITPIKISDEWYQIAKYLDSYKIKDLNIAWILLQSPCSIKDRTVYFLEQVINSISQESIIPLPKTSITDLDDAELSYKFINLYIWLSLRLENYFPYLEDAKKQNNLINEAIYEFLKNTKFKYHVCKSCGNQLPINFKHKFCDSCYFSRNNWDIDEDFY
jgi:ATP-dependent RNA helicase SUPV3L1/SUV3